MRLLRYVMAAIIFYTNFIVKNEINTLKILKFTGNIIIINNYEQKKNNQKTSADIY